MTVEHRSEFGPAAPSHAGNAITGREEFLRRRLALIARRRPGTVLGVLQYWLEASPAGNRPAENAPQ